MKKILIHIGTRKTGTSSIQNSLSIAAEEGQLYPIVYPRRILQATNHGFLACLYKPYEKLPRQYKSRYYPEDILLKKHTIRFKKKLFKDICSNDNIIISSEYLASFESDEFKLFKKDLEMSGVDDVRIVIYVRDPVSHYLSSTQQWLKASHQVNDPKLYKYYFKDQITNWSSEFPGKITVRPFAKSMLYHNCVVKDFCRIASDYMSHDITHIKAYNVNESLSAEGMFLLQKYRSFFYQEDNNLHKRDSGLFTKLLLDSKNVIAQTQPMLKKEIEAVILNNYKEDLAWLKKHYGISFIYDNNNCKEINEVLSESHGQGINLKDVIQEYDDEIIQNILLYIAKVLLEKQNLHSSAFSLKNIRKLLKTMSRSIHVVACAKQGRL